MIRIWPDLCALCPPPMWWSQGSKHVNPALAVTVDTVFQETQLGLLKDSDGSIKSMAP